MLAFSLPVPPSTNHLFVNLPGKGRVKSAEYKAWISAAGWQAKTAVVGKETFKGKPVAVTYSVPENQRRDLDNYLKALNDVLKLAQIIEDDRHIRKIEIGRWDGQDVRVVLQDTNA